MPSEPGRKPQSTRKPNIPVVYRDSCVFIDWLDKKRPDRINLIDPLVSMAQNGELKIITSVIAEGEVIKWPEEGISDQESNRRIADFFKNPWIIRRSVDTRVMGVVRQIRLINKLKLPDAIHVATALISEVAALHTFDHDHLIKRTGKFTIDGKFFLKIVEPENPIPPPPVPPDDPLDYPLFGKRSEEQ